MEYWVNTRTEGTLKREDLEQLSRKRTHDQMTDADSLTGGCSLGNGDKFAPGDFDCGAALRAGESNMPASRSHTQGSGHISTRGPLPTCNACWTPKSPLYLPLPLTKQPPYVFAGFMVEAAKTWGFACLRQRSRWPSI